jgi:hypothetical protein
MSWYKKATFNLPYGEYWIDDSGNIHFADGDIGEKGHANHVIEQILNNINVDYNRFFQLLESDYPLEDGSKDIYEFCKKRGLNTQETSMLIDGINGNDANNLIQYAMKKWKWKRVVGNRVETWQLTNYDFEIILNGINNIAEEDEYGESVWTIEVASNRNIYINVPLKELETGISSLARHNNTKTVFPMNLPNSLANRKIAKPIMDLPEGLHYYQIAHQGTDGIYLFVVNNNKFEYVKIKEPRDTHNKNWVLKNIMTLGRIDIIKKIASLGIRSAKNLIQDNKRIDLERKIAVDGIHKNFGNDIRIYET